MAVLLVFSYGGWWGGVVCFRGYSSDVHLKIGSVGRLWRLEVVVGGVKVHPTFRIEVLYLDRRIVWGRRRERVQDLALWRSWFFFFKAGWVSVHKEETQDADQDPILLVQPHGVCMGDLLNEGFAETVPSESVSEWFSATLLKESVSEWFTLTVLNV